MENHKSTSKRWVSFLYYFLLCITIVFHPVFLPVYVVVWDFFSRPKVYPMVYNFFMPFDMKFKWVLLYSGFLAVLPVLMLVLARMLRLVHTITLNSVRDRENFFLIMGVYYWCVFYIFSDSDDDESFRPSILLVGVMSVVAFLASLLSMPTFKVSIHTAGMGAICGLFVMFSVIFEGYFIPELVTMLVLSTVVMLSRILLNAHHYYELISGWVIGLLSSVGLFYAEYSGYFNL